MRRYLYLTALLLAIHFPAAAQSFTLDSTTITADTLITGLNVPWEITWGPDDHIWMTERQGKVSRVNPVTGTREVILDISQANAGPVYQASEAGLLGLALHPDFPDSSYVFIVYTYRQNNSTLERMVRYRFDTDTLVNPVPFIEGIPGNTTHDGSRLVFGPDRKLYMTTGDAQNQPSAQNVGGVNGKTLRFNLDGSVPNDNPIGGSYVWSWGHRNHQGLTFGPTGILYSSEHGPNTDDELNIIHKARNYGWPTVAGYCNLGSETAFCVDSNVVEPLAAWSPTIAPSDLIYYNHPSIPEWQGTLLMTVLKNKRLIRFQLNANGDAVTAQTNYFINQWGRLRDICAAPDGTIYIATNGADWGNTDPNTHSIIRIKNPNYSPPLTVDLGNGLSVCSGGNVQLNATVTGGALPLTYLWAPAGNINCTNCPNPMVGGLTADTEFILTVTDNNGNSASDTMVVNVVQQPGPITYNFTILDTNQAGMSPVQFDISAPAADSVRVVINNNLLPGPIDITVSNQQQFTLSDSLRMACSIGHGGCFMEFTICLEAFSSCNTIVLCDTQRIQTVVYDGIATVQQPTFTLYPNPSTGTVTLSGVQQADRITVLNSVGMTIREIVQPVINGGDYLLNLSYLEPGIYFIGVERNGAVGMEKLIKY